MEGFRFLEMEPVASAVERLKEFAKSGDEFVRGTLQRLADEEDARRRDSPIEILKRLQREAFSDLMKLREKQDKLERVLSYQTSKGSPLQKESTHMRGVVNVFGALPFVRNDSLLSDDINRTRIRTGIDSRFIFEAVARKKDALMAEFVASHNWLGYHGDVHGSPLSLSKVIYSANINDWLSLISIPLGARCKDFGSSSLPLQVLTGTSSFGPPLLDQSHDFAVGLRTKGSNFGASAAVLVSKLGMQPSSVTKTSLGSFGQIDYQLFEGTKVTLSGLWPMEQIRIGKIVIPLGASGQQRSPDRSVTRNKTDNGLPGSIALMLESELDECSRIAGWVQLQKSSLKNLHWAVSLSDTPEDEVG